MLNFNTFIKNEYESAYESAYDLPLKKQYSNPKIYYAKGDLKKRWYVYFSFIDPATDKMKRQTPFYGNANTYKTKEERLAVLAVYRKTILRYLDSGYSPYQDNEKRYLEEVAVKTKAAANSKPIISIKPEKEEIVKDHGMAIDKAIEFDRAIKRSTLRESSLRSYRSHIGVFAKWLKSEYPNRKWINEIDRKIANGFLNQLLTKSSARNRNNYRASLSSLFQCLEDNEIVESNIIQKIRVLKSDPKRNKVYSKSEEENIFEYLKEQDPILLLYVKFVAYNFLRPIEVCRLKVGDLNLEEGTLSFKAKNSPQKTKLIPMILLDDLPDLSELDKDKLLFTPKGLGKDWDAKLESRRGYFTKRFGKTVKKKFSLDLDHTLYGFRHTYITKIYRKFANDSSPFEAKSRLMQITGHSSMVALEKYLRELDAELPKDYSNMLRKKDN